MAVFLENWRLLHESKEGALRSELKNLTSGLEKLEGPPAPYVLFGVFFFTCRWLSSAWGASWSQRAAGRRRGTKTTT